LIFKAVREKEFTSQKLKLIIMFLGDWYINGPKKLKLKQNYDDIND
jgi:hypothetical protein